MRRNKNSQNGSVLIYVIIGVALFGMLMYSLLKGGSTSSSIGTKGNAKAQAMAILEYTRTVQGEVERMLASGISENQIDGDSLFYSRWNPSGAVQWGPNPNCPNTSCKLFLSKGGRVKDANFRLAETPYFSPYSSSHPYPGDPVLSQMNLLGVGTAKYDLAILIIQLKNNVCQELNKMVGTPNATANDEGWQSFGHLGITAGTKYYEFDIETREAVGNQNPSLVGKRSACTRMSSYGNVFYHTLIAR